LKALIWSRSISVMLGICALSTCREASHNCERMKALAQCKYTDSTATRMTTTGARRASAHSARSAGSVDNTARPLTRKVSSKPGTMNSKPKRPVAMMFSSVSSRLLPGASGSSSVCASGTLTKPGSPPRGDASMCPPASLLASTTKGDKPTNCCACASSAGISFLSARSRAGP
jgi:hypothetical protein